MITLLLASARAEPPRFELGAGWAGNVDHGHGYVVGQPALARATRASVMARAAVTRSWWTEGADDRVEATGATLGPAFVWSPGRASLGAAVGLGVRRITGGPSGPVVGPSAALSASAFWRPAEVVELSALGTFEAVDPYAWGRLGAAVRATGGRGALAVWAGMEFTDSGTFTTRDRDLGPVVQLHLRPLRSVLAVRASLPTSGQGPPTLGVSTYSPW